MKKAMRVALLVAVLLLVMSFPLSIAADKGKYPTSPKMNNGKKWRIGYLEGGRYINYPINLRELAAGFMELGWMEKAPIPEPDESHDARKIWIWLARNGKSDYIQFVEDAFWSSDFNKNLRAETKSKVLKRLNGKGDIDFMIAMGTWAGQDLANNQHSVSTMVMSTSDPIQSKIIKSAEDSGFDHVQTDLGDTRLNHYFLESHLRWLGGEEGHSAFRAPMAHPAPATLALGDYMLSFVPVYAPFRIVGFGPRASFQLWYVAMGALNFVLFFLFLPDFGQLFGGYIEWFDVQENVLGVFPLHSRIVFFSVAWRFRIQGGACG